MLFRSDIVDAFNLNLSGNLPTIYTITSNPKIDGDGEYTNFTITKNKFTMFINKLKPNQFITISFDILVNSTPIMGKEYTILSDITNGTSQPSLSSHLYTYNKYPLKNNLILKGCTPTITKKFNSSTIKLYEEYLVTITILFPKGILAYNTKIKDSLISTDSSNLSNLLLNGKEVNVDITTNNLIVPLNDTLNTTEDTILYTLPYNDTPTKSSPIDYEENIKTNVSIDWSETLGSPETYSVSTSDTLKIVIPFLSLTKMQKNVTDSLTFDKNPIYAKKNDTINYKLIVNNIGKAPAFSIILSDIIPLNLSYISNNSNGTYDDNTRKFTLNLSTLDINNTENIILTLKVINDNTQLISSNSYISSYLPNETTLPEIIYTSYSNITKLYNPTFLPIILKLQRNISANENFTTSKIRCFHSQSIQYKSIITNPFKNKIVNITVTDIFPDIFTFISFNPFIEGNLSIFNNVITAKTPSIEPETTIEYIYTLTLNNDILSLESSIDSISYYFEEELNELMNTSNILFISLSQVGKGFLAY